MKMNEVKFEFNNQIVVRNSENTKEDSFVGFRRINNKKKELIEVTFPIGYDFSKNISALKEEIIGLIRILNTYKNGEYNFLHGNFVEELPLQSHKFILEDYLEREELYHDEELVPSKNFTGRIDWNYTIKKTVPIYDNGNFIYLDLFSRSKRKNSSIITEIHRFCLTYSISKFGWLYNIKPTELQENKLQLPRHVINEYLGILNEYINHTFLDYEKKLFASMRDILTNSFYSHKNSERFGTHSFEYVWEMIVDRVFGISNKTSFFPRTFWKLEGETRKNSALLPDTIMEYNNKYFIIDSKYYKYGITKKTIDLPNSSSISKQIYYGQYISKKILHSNFPSLYNAFVMPYNASLGPSSDTLLSYIGEAIGNNDSNRNKTYEFIQGILIDTKYLVNTFLSNDYNNAKKELSNFIISNFNS